MSTVTSVGGRAPSLADLPKRVVEKTLALAARNPVARRRDAALRRRVLTRDFLESDAYVQMISHDYQTGADGLNSAEWLTPNFRWRHFRRQRVLGAWRWLGVYENRAQLIPLVFGAGRGLDFGGARGPISPDVAICDRLDRDIFRRRVPFHSLTDVPDGSFDFVWSSHTLEHIPDLDATLGALAAKLKPGGTLALLLPAYTCARWRAGTHAYRDRKGASPHVHTFYLALDPNVTPDLRADPAAVPIDVRVRQHVTVEQAAMVGDNSIWIVGRTA